MSDTNDDARETTAPESLTRSTVRGAVWNYTIYAASKFVAFLSSVVLARLLVPDDFGLLALALLALTYVDVLNEFGVSAGVIFSKGDVDHNSNVGFLLSCVTGLLAFGLVFLIAPTASSFFREPDLTSILRVMAIAFLLSSLGSVHEARLRKRLSFKDRLIPELARAIVKAVVSIGLALIFDAGVWSLVWGQLASSLAATIGYWAREPWRPEFTWDPVLMKRLVKYGGGFMGATVAGVILKDVDYLIIGRRLDADELGLYSLGYRLPELAVMGATYAFSQTVFPVFARLRDDTEQLHRAFLKTIRTLAFVTMPIGVGIALVSSDFVKIIYGNKWGPTGTVMPWIALATVVTSAIFVTGDIYKATGKLRILNIMGFVRLPINIAVLLFAVRYGIRGVAIAQFGLSLAALALQLYTVQRVLAIKWLEIVRSLVPALIATGVMSGACVIGLLTLQSDSGRPSRLVATMLLGILAYGGVIALFYRSLVADVLRALQRKKMAV